MIDDFTPLVPIQEQVLEIDLATWSRGGLAEYSRLYNSHTGKKCCLGFECLLRGISLDVIKDMTMPYAIWGHEASKLGGMATNSYDDTVFSLLAARINDAKVGVEDRVGERVRLEDLPPFLKSEASVTLESEEHRQELIRKLFLYYLGRKVVYVNSDQVEVTA